MIKRWFFLVLMFVWNLGFSQQIGSDANAPMIQEESIKEETPFYVDDIKRIQEAFNQSKSDSNVIIYSYDSKKTYKVRLRSFMTAVIHLPEWEEVHAYTLGDTHIFNFQVLSERKNIGILQNKFAGADSNLTIIGKSGNIYNFYVRVDNVKSAFLPQNVVYIQAEQPKTIALKPLQKSVKSSSKQTQEGVADYLRAIDTATRRQLETRQDIDLRYVIYINEDMIPPTKVFSDGYWTYFKIGQEKNLDKVEDLPALFMVNAEGAEVPANIRVVNGYLIAEQVGKAWVLRQGEKYLCIQKDIYKKQRNFH